MPDQPVTRGYVVGPREGGPNRGPEVKASSESTAGRLTLIELTIDGGPPRQVHSREDESLYVHSGTLEVECGEDRFQAGPGSFVFLPRNLPTPSAPSAAPPRPADRHPRGPGHLPRRADRGAGGQRRQRRDPQHPADLRQLTAAIHPDAGPQPVASK